MRGLANRGGFFIRSAAGAHDVAFKAHFQQDSQVMAGIRGGGGSRGGVTGPRGHIASPSLITNDKFEMPEL